MVLAFKTARIQAFLLDAQYARALHQFYTRNSEHLAPWEPRRPAGYHSIKAWEERLVVFQQEQQQGISRRLVAVQPNQDEIVGTCFFTNISHGAFQACNLGYSISKNFEGAGLMTEIVEASVNYIFQELNLHRVMANYVPENARSARVLEKLGFEKEGLAKSYLKIAGSWQDHVLTSKLNPAHENA